jgi:ribosome maturation protein Sdo1
MPYTSQQTVVLCVMKKVFPLRMVLLKMQIRQRSTKEYVQEQTSKLNSYGCLTNQQFSNDGNDEKER